MGQREAVANAVVLFGPIVVGLTLGILGANATFAPIRFGWFTLGLYGVGLALFLIAKVSVLRGGTLLSIGSVQMSTWSRRAYRAGYFLMGFALISTAALFMALGAGPSS